MDHRLRLISVDSTLSLTSRELLMPISRIWLSLISTSSRTIKGRWAKVGFLCLLELTFEVAKTRIVSWRSWNPSLNSWGLSYTLALSHFKLMGFLVKNHFLILHTFWPKSTAICRETFSVAKICASLFSPTWRNGWVNSRTLWRPFPSLYRENFYVPFFIQPAILGSPCITRAEVIPILK